MMHCCHLVVKNETIPQKWIVTLQCHFLQLFVKSNTIVSQNQNVTLFCNSPDCKQQRSISDHPPQHTSLPVFMKKCLTMCQYTQLKSSSKCHAPKFHYRKDRINTVCSSVIGQYYPKRQEVMAVEGNLRIIDLILLISY